MKKPLFLIVSTVALVTGAILNQGCVPVLIAAVAYNHVHTKDAYNAYVTETRKDNTEREEHGLKPNPILSYDDWKKSGTADQSATTATNQTPKQIHSK